jgi:ABC-type uncharacterized transport system permease subunit
MKRITDSRGTCVEQLPYFMARRIAFIMIWTVVSFLAAFVICFLLGLVVFGIFDRESELAKIFLALVGFVLMPLLTLTGCVLAIFRRLPGTRLNDTDER